MNCSSVMKRKWRLELFFRSKTELQGKVIPLLNEFKQRGSLPLRVNLTNKAKDDQLLDAVQLLKSEIPELDVCVHYSCKWNYHRTVDASFSALEETLKELSILPGTSVLLVSGGGKKRPLDTVKALHLAARRPVFRQMGVPLYVAFNPYLPDEADQREERARLRAKLRESGGLVQGVYLQMGTDMGRLRDGLRYLQGLAERAGGGLDAVGCVRGGSAEDGRGGGMSKGEVGYREAGSGGGEGGGVDWGGLHVLGSVFIPSKRLLAQMRFRPWNGVFLCEEYLGGVEAAEGITRQILQVYSQFGVEPLVETAVRSAADLDRVHQLVGGARQCGQ